MCRSAVLSFGHPDHRNPGSYSVHLHNMEPAQIRFEAQQEDRLHINKKELLKYD